ncbi:MAG: TonB-dependent receptor [Lacunisphaera sp.]|nr:TonB-dependent receptor [Lacunisphaera sp.]
MNNSSVSLRKPLALLGVGLSLFAASAAFAQQPAASAQALKLDKFVVTGSYIPMAGISTAIPVTVLNAQAIEDTGVTTNVLEILRKAAPQFSGNGNLGNSNANISSGSTGGGSALAFRNTQTLVLINGRRAAYAPILSSGGFQYVDVNLIPVSAIERIEILQDGASALYGTDAVSGVVNIILKHDYKGFEVNGYYGFTDNQGKYAQRKFSVVGGTGTEKTSITMAAEWSSADPLWQFERSFSNPAYGTPSFAGVVDIAGQFYVLKPGLNAPPTGTHQSVAALVAAGIYIPVNQTALTFGPLYGADGKYSFNLANAVTVLLRNERKSVTLNFEHKVNDSMTLFGDMLYTQTGTFSQLNAQPTNTTAPATHPLNPFDVAARARNRFVDHPRQYYYDTDSLRGVLGLRGSFGNGYTWETGANKNIIKQQYRNEGVIDTATRVAVVAAGQINYFARQQAAGAVESSGMFGTALGTSTSTLLTYDARVTGEVFDLPAGPLGFAAGVEYREETLNQTADRGSQSATFSWDSATTLDPFNSGRNIKSAFAEVRIPIFGGDDHKTGAHLLELQMAARKEIYSDTDDPLVPKFSLRWLPVDDQFAVRATYSKSFSAPTLFNLFGPGGIGFTDSLSLARLGGGARIVGQANARSGANPNLLPSRSKNYTFGFVWSPKAVKGLSLTLDYFDIKQTDLISTIGSETILQDVELLGTASAYANFVRIGPASDTSQFVNGAKITAAGQIGNRSIDDIYVTDTLVNIAQQHLAGIDMKVDYTWNSDALGKFDMSLAGTYYDKYIAQTLPSEPEFETAGYATNFNGTIAKWQTYTSVNWSRGKWRGTLGWTYIPSVDDASADPAETDVAFDTQVEAYHSFDISGSYTFGSEWKMLSGATVRIGANNVLNEAMPMAGSTFTESNGDISTYNPIGRLIFMDVRFKF